MTKTRKIRASGVYGGQSVHDGPTTDHDPIWQGVRRGKSNVVTSPAPKRVFPGIKYRGE